MLNFFKSELRKKFEDRNGYLDIGTPKLLGKAKGSKTWYGSRVFTIEGIKGSLSIDQISKRLIGRAKENERTGYLDVKYRTKTIQLITIVRRLYRESDSTTSKITNFFNGIREYFFGRNIRDQIESEVIIKNLGDYSHKRPRFEDEPDIL